METFRQDHSSTHMKGAFFEYATQRLQEYLDECIKAARSDKGESSFRSDIRVSFNIQDYLLYLLGNDVVSALEGIVNNCQKKVLVTLDDFDTIFDTFRRAAKSDQDARRRALFETDWLRSFLLLILKLKDTEFETNPFFRTLDFCITVPKDRFLEIERSERDGYRYDPRTSSIDWSGIELCDVLFRRIERLYGYQGRVDAMIHDKFREMFRNEFPLIPDEVQFEFNGKETRIPLFCYVLRHTFWRPRDLLMYYADILAASFSVKKSGYKLTTAIIRRIISESTYSIIKTEFLDEYESSVANIRQIVNSFMEYPQVFPYEKIESAIGNLPFLFISAEDPNK